MNQDPPVLIPYVDKDIYNDASSTNSIENGFVLEPVSNGYLLNGSKSPQMPTLYEADIDPPPLFNMQDIFSALTKNEYNDTDYSKFESRNDSASLFEKIYKDYSTTLNSSNQIISSKNSINSQVETDVDIKMPQGEAATDLNRESQENNDNSSSQVEIPVKKVVSREIRKYKKRNLKKDIDTVTDNEDLSKLGIKTIRKRKNGSRSGAAVNNNAVLHNKETSDNKYLRSPFIALRHCTPKKMSTATNVISSSYEIVNPALRGSTDHHTSIYRPNTKTFFTNQFSSATPCLCGFCGQTYEFLQLGSLYGPYFIDRDSVHTLPLTSIFPTESNEIGISGKSAIKSDKNGNLKMVIQSTRNSRNNASKKAVNEDYRVTWEGEVWMHRECVLWAPGTFLRGDGKIGGLDEALKMALNAECFVCHKIGAILNCTTKNCEKNFHYYCAVSQDCKLNDDQFSVLCNKHKDR